VNNVNSNKNSGHEVGVGRYSHGSTAILVLLLITLVTDGMTEISRQIDYSGEINFFAQYVGLWKFFAGIATGLLSFRIVRMALRLWQEQYQLQVHQSITIAVIAGLLVGIFSSTLYDGMLWFKWYVALPAGLFQLTNTTEWDAIFSSLPNVWRLATLTMGGALIAFGLQEWFRHTRWGGTGFPRTLSVLISAMGALFVMDSIIGLRLIPINGYYIDRYYNPAAAVSQGILMLMLLGYLFFAFRAKSALTCSRPGGVS
jgi:hypothetical protein